MRIKLFIWNVLLLFLISGCNGNEENINAFDPSSITHYDRVFNKKSSSIEGLQLEGAFDLEISGSKRVLVWNVIQSNDQQISFSLPEEWKAKDKDNTLFFCNIDTSGFFAILAHKKEDYGVDLETYVNLFNDTILNDTTEIFTVENSLQLIKSAREAFYYKLFSEEAEDDRIYYSLITENQSYIFDFSLKLENVRPNNLYDLIFNVIVHSFQINNSNLLESDGDSYEISIGSVSEAE